jgi:hypothetical protein
MRPLPRAFVNSLSSTPILRSTHSSASFSPVTNACFGISPSALFFGSRVSAAATAVVVQAVTVGMVTWRRQRPI